MVKYSRGDRQPGLVDGLVFIMTITERDELGRIKKGGKVLTSQEAGKIGKLGYQVKKASSREQLLVEAGYDNPKDAPEHLHILAKQAITSTPAMNAFLRLTQPERIEERKNGACPYQDTCTIFRNEEI